MLRKLLIRTYLGKLPGWYDQWIEHVKHLERYGFHVLIDNDTDAFRARCKDVLGLDVDGVPGTRKAGDYCPAFGNLYAKELACYDFWGHVDLDVVLGRLDHFVSDEFLSDCDVFGNDPNAICGPFSLYRNVDTVNNLFTRFDGWQEIFEARGELNAFDEKAFTGVVLEAAERGDIRFKSAFWQAHDTQRGHSVPQISILSDGTLVDRVTGKETMMFHFHKYRQWPIS